jgi:hypothetical protein
MMRAIVVMILGVTLVSCSSQHNEENKTGEQPGGSVQTNPVSQPSTPVEASVNFLQSYCSYSADMTIPKEDPEAWVGRSGLVTENFLKTFHALCHTEEGLDYDPILVAQDIPDSTFAVVRYDSTAGFVTVRGIHDTSYVIVVKPVLQNGKWLIDGVGDVNIPEDRRPRR